MVDQRRLRIHDQRHLDDGDQFLSRCTRAHERTDREATIPSSPSTSLTSRSFLLARARANVARSDDVHKDSFQKV